MRCWQPHSLKANKAPAPNRPITKSIGNFLAERSSASWLLNNKSGPTECTKLSAQPSQTAATKDTKQPSTHSSSNAPTLHQRLPLSSPTSASASLTRNLAYTERCVRGYTLSLLLAFCRDELPTKWDQRGSGVYVAIRQLRRRFRPPRCGLAVVRHGNQKTSVCFNCTMC